MMNQQENRRYSFVKRTFWSAMLMMSLCASGAQAQTVLKGTVHDSSGEPLVGVTVVMNGNSKTATVTDIDGRYSVNVGPKQKADYLSFSYVGMKPANVLTSSLKKHTFYNLLINNILYLCVT